MARKIFQDFAHVLCQKFIDSSSNVDWIDLVILGDGKLQLEITARRARQNRAAVSSIPYMKEVRDWLDGRMLAHGIQPTEMTRAALTVECRVTLLRPSPLNWLSASFDFNCVGMIDAPDRSYSSTLSAQREWGLSQVSPYLERIARDSLTSDS
jgi:hypothetical protein